MDHYPLEERAVATAQVGEAAVAQPADAAVDDDEGPPSRTTMFVAAVWQAFTAAPPGRKPCIACVFLRFANGRYASGAGFVGAGRGLDQHYQRLHPDIYGNRRHSKCSKCGNWFRSFTVRKSHQKLLGRH